jgi:predicted TIM-barrel fold metal-dependent hydrolase
MKQKLDFDIEKYKIIDSHCHLTSNFEDMQKNLEIFNIEKFCLMPTVIENDFFELSNFFKKLKPINSKFKNACLIFGALNFLKSPEENREIMLNQRDKEKIRGIKFHYEQNFILDKKYLRPYFQVIEDVFGYEIPIYIHTDWPLVGERLKPMKLKDSFSKFPDYFPDFKFIMGHGGGSGAYVSIWKVCKKYSNVYVESSMCPTTQSLEEVIWRVGDDRVLFGSNFPYCGTSIEVVKILSMYQVSDEDRKNIFYNNAKELFEL